MKPERRVVDVGSSEWLACCAYHESLAKGASYEEAERAHDEALEEAVRAKSDWMQVFENDLTRAAAGLKYPVTKYETPYYAGVEVPATYEKEYHASIIRVGQLEAEVKALRAEVTRLAEWRLMVEEQGVRIGDGAEVADERPAESSRPTLSDHVEKVLEGLSQGMTTTSQEERLTRGLQDRKLGRISRR